MTSDSHAIRELFIDDLEQVHGGIPPEELIRRALEAAELPPTETTMACCEEGSDNCC